MATPSTIYPFATMDGQAIPLDIIKSKSLIWKSYNDTTISYMTIPTGTLVAIARSPYADCIIQPASPGVSMLGFPEDAAMDGAIYIPADTLMTISLEGVSSLGILGAGASGSFWLQVIEKWSGLALNTQYNRK